MYTVLNKIGRNKCLSIPKVVASVYAGSTYTMLTGYPGSEYASPGTKSSLLSLTSGALCGLADAARAEHAISKVAVTEVHLKCLVHKQASYYLLI